MKMRALDSFYSSETWQAHAGQEFEIDSVSRGKDFAKRGLAEIIPEPLITEAEMAEAKRQADAAEAQRQAAKQEQPPANKAELAPINKAETAPQTKTVGAPSTKA